MVWRLQLSNSVLRWGWGLWYSVGMRFYEEVAKLKTLVRSGWKLRGVKGRKESDGEHTFSTMILALEIMCKSERYAKLDQLKV